MTGDICKTSIKRINVLSEFDVNLCQEFRLMLKSVNILTAQPNFKACPKQSRRTRSNKCNLLTLIQHMPMKTTEIGTCIVPLLSSPMYPPPFWTVQIRPRRKIPKRETHIRCWVRRWSRTYRSVDQRYHRSSAWLNLHHAVISCGFLGDFIANLHCGILQQASGWFGMLMLRTDVFFFRFRLKTSGARHQSLVARNSEADEQAWGKFPCNGLRLCRLFYHTKRWKKQENKLDMIHDNYLFVISWSCPPLVLLLFCCCFPLVLLLSFSCPFVFWPRWAGHTDRPLSWTLRPGSAIGFCPPFVFFYRTY